MVKLPELDSERRPADSFSDPEHVRVVAGHWDLASRLHAATLPSPRTPHKPTCSCRFRLGSCADDHAQKDRKAIETQPDSHNNKLEWSRYCNHALKSSRNER
ncbi:hypothetical protein Bbelb_014760 [Branchiostoma belcheri]|nr:hypothetical protein Bbelb_014760 [Branchiostoma belcheri]